MWKQNKKQDLRTTLFIIILGLLNTVILVLSAQLFTDAIGYITNDGLDLINLTFMLVSIISIVAAALFVPIIVRISFIK